jgi:choline dehydrogenase-like flavoprotein
MPRLDTDVLVIGSGPAGASAALALATYGVRTTVITEHGRLADTPRAHITNQRTMEALRDLGVEDEVMDEATPQHLMGNLVYCTSAVVGERLAIEIAAVVIGPGRTHDDLYGDWARVRGIEDGGVLLARPDNYVAFRHAAALSDAEAEAALESALRTVLDTAGLESVAGGQA